MELENGWFFIGISKLPGFIFRFHVSFLATSFLLLVCDANTPRIHSHRIFPQGAGTDELVRLRTRLSGAFCWEPGWWVHLTWNQRLVGCWWPPVWSLKFEVWSAWWVISPGDSWGNWQKVNHQVIQAVPFSSPIVGESRFHPLKGSRFHHPKKVTNGITRKGFSHVFVFLLTPFFVWGCFDGWLVDGWCLWLVGNYSWLMVEG